jgi:hypothetical protein
MPTEKRILIVGDPVNGLTFYGPLPTGGDVDLHNPDLPDQDRWLADLHALPNAAEAEPPSEAVVAVPRGELEAARALAHEALRHATGNAPQVNDLCERLECWGERDHE